MMKKWHKIYTKQSLSWRFKSVSDLQFRGYIRFFLNPLKQMLCSLVTVREQKHSFFMKAQVSFFFLSFLLVAVHLCAKLLIL